MVVSIMETRKAPDVEILDLPRPPDSRIVPFMRHDIEMGKLIKALMAARPGVTQQRLADLISVEKGAISKKLNAQGSSFDDVELEKIGKFFGIPAWKLYAMARGVDPEKLDFADAYDVVTPGFRKDILRMMKDRKNAASGE